MSATEIHDIESWAWPAHVRVHHSSDAFVSVRDLALAIAGMLRAALVDKERAVLSVSGGTSPVPLFELLSQIDLDWSRVTVTLVDERQVSADHPASNTRLVKQHLLQQYAAAAQLLSFVDSGLPQTQVDWVACASRANDALLALGPADVTVLGMGLDGHFASIFPQALEREEALAPQQMRACMTIHLQPAPVQAPFDRISQTLAHICRSRHVILPVAGNEKLSVLQRALAHQRPDLPISALLSTTAPLSPSDLMLWIKP
mgnify:FL=1